MKDAPTENNGQAITAKKACITDATIIDVYDKVEGESALGFSITFDGKSFFPLNH